MRILVSLENEQNLELLASKLCSFLSIIDGDDLFVDILHVYEPAEGHASDDVAETIKDIIQQEHKMKIKLISECENTIEKFIQDKLDKSSLVNSYLLKGNYKKKLEKHIKFQQYDLLILNPGKKKDFDLILKGRNTHWIIDNLEVPVLVLPSYLGNEDGCEWEITCFVDDISTFNNISRAALISKIKDENIKYVHFGKEEIHEKVEIIFSSNILDSISSHTKLCNANKVFVLNHKNKGKFLSFLDKGFTKTVVNSLENPLLIF